MKKIVNWFKNEIRLLRKIDFNKLEILVFTSQKQHNKYMDKLNKETAVIMDNVYNYYVSQLSQEKQKKMFHDWWYGKCVSTEEYQSKLGIDEESCQKVHSCIMEAVSSGFG